MNNYFKVLTEQNIRYHEGLKKGVRLYEGVPSDENLFALDKYVFKNGDLMGEIQQEDFPFQLKSDVCLTVLNVKGEAINYIVEVEGPQTYFVKYCAKNFGFLIVISYNEKAGEVIANANINKELLEVFNNRGIKKEQLIDISVNNISKMISILSNDDYNLKHPMKSSMTVRTKNSIKNIGTPTLVTTRHKNMLHVCDGFPYFYEVDFKKMDKENPIEEA